MRYRFIHFLITILNKIDFTRIRRLDFGNPHNPAYVETPILPIDREIRNLHRYHFRYSIIEIVLINTSRIDSVASLQVCAETAAP